MPKNTVNPQQQVINQIYERLKDKKLSHELNPPCETILMATEKQFREFAAKVAVAIEAHELAAKTEAAIHIHELDGIWMEAKRIVASMDKHNENT